MMHASHVGTSRRSRHRNTAPLVPPTAVPTNAIPVAAADTGTARPSLQDPEARVRRIAEAAYFVAEKRGFAGGGELDDWLLAEVEIDRLLHS
jgi:hypothetical protein